MEEFFKLPFEKAEKEALKTGLFLLYRADTGSLQRINRP
jgi:hypothetical protein